MSRLTKSENQTTGRAANMRVVVNDTGVKDWQQGSGGESGTEKRW